MLMSGHHAQIERWRRDQRLRLTARHRPDLLAARARPGASARWTRLYWPGIAKNLL
jgi:tRNA (guanine37-N1)-methyltransferase